MSEVISEMAPSALRLCELHSSYGIRFFCFWFLRFSSSAKHASVRFVRIVSCQRHDLIANVEFIRKIHEINISKCTDVERERER